MIFSETVFEIFDSEQKELKSIIIKTIFQKTDFL